MTLYSAEEVLNAIEGNYGWDGFYEGKTGVLRLRGVNVPFIARYETSDTDWTWNIAVYIEIGEQVFRKTGWGQSHDGNCWDGSFEEVEAYEETITKYRPISRNPEEFDPEYADYLRLKAKFG